MSGTSDYMWAETILIKSTARLGRVFRDQRRRLGLSQRQLGLAVGVTSLVISRLEADGDEGTPCGAVVRLADALELDLEFRPRGSLFTPRPPTRLDELGLSHGTMAAVSQAGLEDIDQLDSATAVLQYPAFGDGLALYEIVCALNRYGLSLPAYRNVRIPSDRDRQIFRLRIIDGLTLNELAARFSLNRERVRQILVHFFRLSGPPPATTQRRHARQRGVC
jgi:transcriptional regulator with XRE-family HTH domain